MGTRHAILIGIDRYTNDISSLRCAEQDTRDLAAHLQNVLDYEPETMHVFTASSQGPHYPTRDNILAALTDIASAVQPGDTVLFHFSGHGVHLGDNSYLLPVDANPESRGSLASSSISSVDLKLHLSGMACSGIACILDCCRNDPFGRSTLLQNQGGDFGRDILTEMKAAVDHGQAGQPKPQVGILHSCSPNERAWEWEAQGHGFFTHYLLECLRVLAQYEEYITIFRIADYVAQRVNKQVTSIHGCSQEPFHEGQRVEIGSCRAGAGGWVSRWNQRSSPSISGGEPLDQDTAADSTEEERSVVEEKQPQLFVSSSERDVYDIQLIPSVQENLERQGYLREVLVESNEGNRCFLFFAEGEPVFLLHERPVENFGSGHSDAKIILVDPTKELCLVCVESDQGYLKAIGVDRVSVSAMAIWSSVRLVYADFLLYEAGAYHAYAGTRFPHELFENVETPEEKVLKSEAAKKILGNFELFRKTEEARILDSAVRLLYKDVWVERNESGASDQTQCLAHFVVGQIEDRTSFENDEQLRVKHVPPGATVSSVDRAPGVPVGRFARCDWQKGVVVVNLYPQVALDALKGHNLLVTDVGGSLVALRRQQNALVKLQKGRAVSPTLADFVFDVSKVRSPLPEEFDRARTSLRLSSTRFDDSQVDAVAKSMAAPDIAFIQGPPGTGKTTVICEIIRQTLLSAPNAKILVSSQSNMAADNVLGKLGKDPLVRAVRLGREKTVTPEGKGYIAPHATRSWLHAVHGSASRNKDALAFAVGLSDHVLAFEKAVSQSLDRARKLVALDEAIANEEAISQKLCENIAQHTAELANLQSAQVALSEVSVAAVDDLPDGASQLCCVGLQNWTAAVDQAFASDSRKQAANIEASLAEYSRLGVECDRLTSDMRSFAEAEALVGQTLATRDIEVVLRRAAAINRSATEDRRFMTAGSIGSKFHEELAGKVERLRTVCRIHPISWLQRWLRKYSFTYTAAKMTVAKNSVQAWLDESRKAHQAAEASLLSRAQSYATYARRKCLEAIAAHSSSLSDLKTAKDASEAQLAQLASERDMAASAMNNDIEGVECALPLLADAVDTLQHPVDGVQDVLALLPGQQVDIGVFAAALQDAYKMAVGIPRQHRQGKDVLPLLAPLVEKLDRDTASFTAGVKALATKLAPYGEQWIETLSEILRMDEMDPAIISQYTDRVNLVAGTCIGLAGDRKFQASEYDLVVIDEAGRATPLELLVPMLQGRRFVLVGDHRQLPPHIDDNTLASFRKKLRDAGDSLGSTTCPYFEHSFFQEFFEGCPDTVITTLSYQYRMHPQIRELVGEIFYKDVQLQETDSDALRRQNDHPFKDRVLTGRAAVWFDTRSIRQSTARDGSGSMFNETEAELVAQLLLRMSAFRSKADANEPVEVGVITFYSAQKRALAKTIQGLGPKVKRFLDIEIDTVDAFQGREKQIIIVSMVVANPGGRVSRFIASPNRLNVALSRAKELLVLVGNSRTLTQGRGHGKELFGDLLSLLSRQSSLEDYPYHER